MSSDSVVPVAVLGDTVIDETVFVAPSRVCSENRHVLVQEVVTQKVSPGGAANVALNARALGSEVAYFGLDSPEQELALLLPDRGVKFHADALLTYPVARKRRYYTTSGLAFRVDREPPSSELGGDRWSWLGESPLRSLIYAFRTYVCASKAVPVLVDYSKGLFSCGHRGSLFPDIFDRTVFIDPGRSDVWASLRRWSAGHVVFKLNLHQALQALGDKDQDSNLRQPDLWYLHVAGRLAKYTLQGHDFQALWLTLGAGGMLLYAPGGQHYFAHNHHRHFVVDVTGAGDTALGVGAALLAQRGGGVARWEDLVEAVALANLAAGVAIQRQGVHVVTDMELLQA